MTVRLTLPSGPPACVPGVPALHEAVTRPGRRVFVVPSAQLAQEVTAPARPRTGGKGCGLVRCGPLPRAAKRAGPQVRVRASRPSAQPPASPAVRCGFRTGTTSARRRVCARKLTRPARPFVARGSCPPLGPHRPAPCPLLAHWCCSLRVASSGSLGVQRRAQPGRLSAPARPGPHGWVCWWVAIRQTTMNAYSRWPDGSEVPEAVPCWKSTNHVRFQHHRPLCRLPPLWPGPVLLRGPGAGQAATHLPPSARVHHARPVSPPATPPLTMCFEAFRFPEPVAELTDQWTKCKMVIR